MMSISDFISLIGKTNKISIVFFVITCILLGYEFYLYRKDKKGNKKPSIPLFNTKGQQPLTVHPAKPMPTPPVQVRTVAQPPVIAQMAPPTTKPAPHLPPKPGLPGLKKKKKITRKAKVAVGATAALAVLTIGIAWKLNQPSSQRAGLTQQNSRADERPTSAVIVPTSAVHSTVPLLPTSVPSPVPSGKAVDLTSNTTLPAEDFSTIASSSASPSASTVQETSTNSGTITQLPVTGGSASASAEATVVPTLPSSGTIQYSLGLLVIASVIMFASFIF